MDNICAIEMWRWRGVMRISWIEKITNEEVLGKIGGGDGVSFNMNREEKGGGR